MRRVVLAWAAWLACGLAFASPTALKVVPGTEPDGKMADSWYGVMIWRYHHLAEWTELHKTKPETPQEQAWHTLIASRVQAWEAMIPSLSADYAPASGPAEVSIIIGNRGSEDAWTAGPERICFSVESLQEVYGDANTPENRARIDRLFRHEFTHILQQAWLASHPATAGTPLNEAGLELWKEGLGNRESLSSKWIDDKGKLMRHARKALDALVPVLIERLEALRTATDSEGYFLMEDMTSGPFEKKWGALPMALWLAEDAARDPTALRTFIEAGPSGALDYAQRHGKAWQAAQR